MQYVPAVDLAKLIRKDLKKAFPTVKFSVKSRKGVMCDTIDVSYLNGPVLKKVSDFLNKYNIRNMCTSNSWPIVSYVISADRDFTDNLVQQAGDYLKDTWNLPANTVSLRGTEFEDFGTINGWARMLLIQLDLTSGAVCSTQFTPLKHFAKFIC